jgi:DNA-binding transcriptional LysR family regulator
MLRVDATTVSRRIAKVERQLGVRLFERRAGVLTPTDSGKHVIDGAERIELDVDAVRDRVSNADNVVIGKVRITAMPMVLNHLLIPALPALLQLYAGLQLELAADPRNLNLTNREADIALRMARPAHGVGGLARRVGIFDYAVYATTRSKGTLPWITYDATWSELPHARWMARAIESDPGSGICIKVNDSELALNAVRAGLGRSLLPRRIAQKFPELARLSGPKAVLSREMWLIFHPDLKHLARVRAVIAWIEGLMSEQS